MNDFEQLVIQNLGDIQETCTKTQESVTDLCSRTGVVEEKVKNLEADWKTHINNEISAELRKRDNRWKLPTIIFGAIASVATIINFFK